MALRIQHWFFRSIIQRKNRELLRREENFRKEREALESRFGLKDSKAHLLTIIEEANLSTSITNVTPTPEKPFHLPQPEPMTKPKNQKYQAISPVSQAMGKKGFKELTPPRNLNFDTERKMSDHLFELSQGSE